MTRKMTKSIKIQFALFISLLVASAAVAQKSYNFSGKLEWYDLAEVDDISSEMGLLNGFFNENLIPIHSKSVRIPAGFQIGEVNFAAGQTSSIKSDWVDGLPITSDFTYKTQIKRGGNEFYLCFELVPVRKNSMGFERLLNYEVSFNLAESTGNPASSRTLTFAEHSALAEGTWFKMAIAKDGVYKIDKGFLNQLGVETNNLDPDKINIYGNGGELLPFDNSVPRADDLVQNSIFVFENVDNSKFDDNDYILFYGKGPDTWNYDDVNGKYIHNKHFYSDSAYYFIRVDDLAPNRVQTANDVIDSETLVINEFSDFQFTENDTYNLVKSGREFYGDLYDVNVNGSYNFSFPNVIQEPAVLDVSVAVRSITQASNFTFTVSGESVTPNTTTVGSGPLSRVADVEAASLSFIPASSNITVAVQFIKGNPDAQGWIDFIRVNARRQLTMAGNQMSFREPRNTGTGQTALYQLSQANTNLTLWDISNPLNPTKVNFNVNGSIAEWKASHDISRNYIVFSGSGFLTPTALGPLQNQDLHAYSDVDLMIVAAPRQIPAAEALAEIHANLGKSVAVVTAPQVYNEFSSGNPDPTAIRMLMKMMFDRAGSDESLKPENLLLFGDGSYKQNKGIGSHNGFNVIVFESAESTSPTGSYVSDDFFVFLDDDDNESPANKLDCGLGRIPASNLQEGLDYVEKLRLYVSQNTSPNGGADCLGDEVASPFGAWRNSIVLVSDDQDGNGSPTEEEHLSQNDFLAEMMNEEHNDYDLVKLYMDAFKQETVAGGERYPEGEEAIRQRVQNGALLVTYIGHGGERGWAHERILDIPTIQNWTNKNRLPVFLTATCELARYDDPDYNSAGEILVMNPNGGAIAMLTTTRVVTSGSNFEIDIAFFENAFNDALDGNLTLGKVNMLTKNNVADSNSSKPNFSLLGDPALIMAYPKMGVFTTQINGVEMALFTDTLKSLQEVEFKGFVGNSEGTKLNDFNGFVYPTVFDKESHITTQNNDGGILQEFDTFNKVIYKGKASVINGDFSFKFVVPYDINYSVDSARVSYYAVAGSLDAHGHNESFQIGSSLQGAELNQEGPIVELFMNDSTFVSGGITSIQPVFFAKLQDENGINTVGNGIGHDLVATIDGNTQNPLILNEYYEADLDTYKKGEIRYQLPQMEEGSHTISLKAWDVHNNSSHAALEFVVAGDAEIALEHVLNYPNPFTTHTDFFFEHNQACESLDVRIQVFTVGGKLVKSLVQQVYNNGFRTDPIPWDGRDDFGDKIGRGVYVYKLEVRNDLGMTAEKFEKLVILN